MAFVFQPLYFEMLDDNIAFSNVFEVADHDYKTISVLFFSFHSSVVMLRLNFTDLPWGRLPRHQLPVATTCQAAFKRSANRPAAVGQINE